MSDPENGPDYTTDYVLTPSSAISKKNMTKLTIKVVMTELGSSNEKSWKITREYLWLLLLL